MHSYTFQASDIKRTTFSEVSISLVDEPWYYRKKKGNLNKWLNSEKNIICQNFKKSNNLYPGGCDNGCSVSMVSSAINMIEP